MHISAGNWRPWPFEPHVFTSLRTILLDAEEDGMGALCQGPTPCLLEEVSHLLYP